MSLKLLKQSLEILEETSGAQQKTAATDKAKTKKLQTGRVGKKPDQRPNTYQHPTGERKKNIEALRKELQPDGRKANENMRRLLALSQSTIKPEAAKKIIKRAHKGRELKQLKRIPKEQKSIFTEEDFLAFERDYCIS